MGWLTAPAQLQQSSSEFRVTLQFYAFSYGKFHFASCTVHVCTADAGRDVTRHPLVSGSLESQTGSRESNVSTARAFTACGATLDTLRIENATPSVSPVVAIVAAVSTWPLSLVHCIRCDEEKTLNHKHEISCSYYSCGCNCCRCWGCSGGARVRLSRAACGGRRPNVGEGGNFPYPEH